MENSLYIDKTFYIIITFLALLLLIYLLFISNSNNEKLGEIDRNMISLKEYKNHSIISEEIQNYIKNYQNLEYKQFSKENFHLNEEKMKEISNRAKKIIFLEDSINNIKKENNEKINSFIKNNEKLKSEKIKILEEYENIKEKSQILLEKKIKTDRIQFKIKEMEDKISELEKSRNSLYDQKYKEVKEKNQEKIKIKLNQLYVKGNETQKEIDLYEEKIKLIELDMKEVSVATKYSEILSKIGLDENKIQELAEKTRKRLKILLEMSKIKEEEKINLMEEAKLAKEKYYEIISSANELIRKAYYAKKDQSNNSLDQNEEIINLKELIEEKKKILENIIIELKYFMETFNFKNSENFEKEIIIESENNYFNFSNVDKEEKKQEIDNEIKITLKEFEKLEKDFENSFNELKNNQFEFMGSNREFNQKIRIFFSLKEKLSLELNFLENSYLGLTNLLKEREKEISILIDLFSQF